MIITCEECSTRFNLDESLLKPGGSKVRCNLCKHVFTAFPQVTDTSLTSEPEKEIKFDLQEDTGLENFEPNKFEPDELEAEDTGLDFEDTDFEIGDLDFEAEETNLDSDGTGLEMEESDGDSAEIEISFDPESDDLETQDAIEFDEDELIFDEVDIEFEEPDLEIEAPETTEDELEADLSFEDDPEADLVFEETGPEQDMELESSDDQDMTFPDLSMETDDQEPTNTQADPGLEFDEDPSEAPGLELDNFDVEGEQHLPDSETQFEENIPEPGDDFASYDQVLDLDTEPEEEFQSDMPDDKPIEGEEPPAESQLVETTPEQDTEKALIEKSTLDHPELDPGRPRKRKKKSAMGAPVMLLLLLFILVAGGYIASMTLGYKIPYLSDIKIPILEKYLKKDTIKKPAPKPVPNEGSVNGRFISNDTAGELFIITGRIENQAAIPYSHIQIKGTLITKGKVKAKTQTIFCGNIISEEMLKTGNISDISKQLTIREGSHNSNVNVKPGGFVPFMLVFSSLPDNLENFTVEVVEF